MKATLTVCVVVIMAAILALTWQLDNRERRITQLEMALAQAHAQADTLVAVIDSLEHDSWEADRPDSNAGPIVPWPCAPLAMLREGE